MSRVPWHVRWQAISWLLVVSAACSQSSSTAPTKPTSAGATTTTTSGAPTPPPIVATPAPSPSPSVPAGIGYLAGAGDIGYCGTGGAEATARLLEALPGTVFTAGDNAYMSGSADDFARCYDPSWGRLKSRTRPTPGNHEYESPGAAPYFEYFGASAGATGEGYYRYSVGPWTIFALNSEVPSAVGSGQWTWLRQELATAPTLCTAAIWHRPLFSSGQNGDNPDMRDLWRLLYEFNVDVVINGHDHVYERFTPLDPDGRADSARGIREFVIGTGGAPLYRFTSVHATSEARGAAWGVGSFTLTGTGYQWTFVPAEGQGFSDAGSGVCH